MVENEKDFVIGDFAARLKLLMNLLKHKNIKDFSEKSGVPYRTIQTYLLGTASPTANTLYRISEAFDVSLDWLVKGEGKIFLNDKESNSILPGVFIERLRKDLDGVSYTKLEELSFFSKIPNVLKGIDTLNRIEVIQLAKTLDQPIEEYLSLANFFPKIFDVALRDKKMSGLLRSTESFTAEEVDKILDTLGLILEGYILKKEKEKNSDLKNND